MARRRSAAASRPFWKPAVESVPERSASGSLQVGQRLAKPGLPGFNSNSSWQITQTRIGNDIGDSREGLLQVVFYYRQICAETCRGRGCAKFFSADRIAGSSWEKPGGRLWRESVADERNGGGARPSELQAKMIVCLAALITRAERAPKLIRLRVLR
jgi:hypothetical protein